MPEIKSCSNDNNTNKSNNYCNASSTIDINKKTGNKKYYDRATSYERVHGRSRFWRFSCSSSSSLSSEDASAGPRDDRQFESQRRQAASTSCNTPGDTDTQRFDVSQCQTTRCLVPRTPSVDHRCGRNRKYVAPRNCG